LHALSCTLRVVSFSIITLFNPVILFNILQNIRVNFHSPVQLSTNCSLVEFLTLQPRKAFKSLLNSSAGGYLTN
jgi:hypothetical protein